jgi:hypothetical protein
MMLMVAMAVPYWTSTRYPFHLVSGDLDGGVEEARESSNPCSHEMVDLVQSTCVTGLVLD